MVGNIVDPAASQPSRGDHLWKKKQLSLLAPSGDPLTLHLEDINFKLVLACFRMRWVSQQT